MSSIALRKRDLNIQNRYAGRQFVFYSPFEIHPGFYTGDIGTLLHIDMDVYSPDEPLRDMWIARNHRDGNNYQVWGGECYTPRGRSIVRPHRFTNWKPVLLKDNPMELLATSFNERNDNNERTTPSV